MGIFGFFKKNKNMFSDNGLNKEYYDDGKGNLEREYYKVNGNKELGEKVFFKSGKIMAEHTFENGKLNGISIVYYESGEKRMEANWEDGMNGKRLEFYLDGTLKSEKNYKNTLLNGPFKEYDEKGNLINEGVYIDDLLESDHKKSILSDLPESPIKSIDDLDLDPETKKKLEENTLFVKEDGTFDESRGSGKDITESLDFIKNIKGIDIEKIVFDLKTFQKMDNNTPPYTDMDGSWYVKFETIMKCFSEKNLEAGLDELLKSNNISKDSGKVNLNVMSGTEPLTFYDGNGFTIDIPPVEGSRKLIVIKNQEIINKDYGKLTKKQIKDRQVYAAIRAYGELMKIDGEFADNELLLIAHFSEEEKNKLSDEYNQESDEFKYVWANEENVFECLKTYNKIQVLKFFENLFSIAAGIVEIKSE